MTTLNIFDKTINMRMRLNILFIFLVGAVSGAHANKLTSTKLTTNTLGRAMMVCSAAQLKIKDCHLLGRGRKIQVWDKKIFLKTPIAYKMIPLSVDDSPDWEFIQMSEFLGRQFLEVAVWTAPQGDGDISSLIWTVYEFNDRSIEKKAEALIQRRRRDNSALKWTYDKIINYGIRTNGKSIEWNAGKERGLINEI